MEADFDLSLIQEYALDAVLALGLLLAVYAGLYLINWLTQLLKKKLQSLNLKSFKVFGLEVINVGKQELALNTVVSLVQILVSVAFIYFSLVIILSQLPATESMAEQLVDLIFEPLQSLLNGFMDYLPRLFNIVVTIIIARYLIKSVRYIVKGVVEGHFHFPGFEPRTARTTGGIITFLLYVMTIIIIFPSLPGYESNAFKGIATFIGALITIGGSSVIANYIAGIVLTYMHAFDQGDWVEIDGITGQVAEAGPFAIRLTSYKMEDVNLPNAKVLGTAIKNFSGKNKDQMIVHTEVSIGYDVHWEKVNQLLVEAANRTALIDKDQRPFVLQKKLDDFYIVYELNAYITDPGARPKTYSTLHANILDLFNEAGIEIMSPHYRAERDGEASTIVVEEEK